MVERHRPEFPVPRPWAKLRRACAKGDPACRERCDCAVAAHLSLIGHSADVAAVLQRLLDLATVRARLARLAGVDELSARDRDRLAALAALHDLGKVNHGFQAKALPASVPGPRCGHVAPLVAVLDSSDAEPAARWILRRFHQLPRFLAVLDWAPEHDLLGPLLAHHGALPGGKEVPRKELWEERDAYDPIAAFGDLLDTIAGWFPAAFEPGPLLPWRERFAHAYAGLLMLADWLGSDEKRFGYGDGEPDGPERFDWSLARADEAIRALQLDPTLRRDATRTLGWTFAALVPELAGQPPRPAQSAMLTLPPAPERGRAVVLEAETGSGKTEAALIHFLDLLRQGRVDGLYFALPTRAAAVQIQARVEKALKRCLGEAAPPVGLAVPGYRKMGEIEPLPDANGRWPDDAADSLRDRFWAVERPKRYLAGAVMVGTVDQALTGALQVRHAQLRSACLLRLLLVVDEVHASDPYMTELLGRLLDQHRAAGGHALLMSATLGADARTRLISTCSRVQPPHPDEAASLPYPSLQVGDGAPQELGKGGTSRPPVRVELCDVWKDVSAAVARAREAAAQGARVLILRNTVRDAVATQQALEEAAVPTLTCGGVPTLHHARFAAEDRKLLDEELGKVLGKEAGRERGMVAVTTQTAEMALDLDADLLITDLCPADVLLQRLGRLHRHRPRSRPPGFEQPLVIVLAPAEEDLATAIQHNGEVHKGPLGLGRIYPDLLGVVATRRRLAELGEVRVPEHCRPLVEAATHTAALECLGKSLGGAWPSHFNKVWGTAAAARSLAHGNAIDWCKPIQPLPDLKRVAAIRTRLGLDDREIDLPPGTVGPFGKTITRLRLPGWMIDDVPVEAQLSILALAPSGLTFDLSEKRFRYDRLGLRPDD